MKRYLLSVTLTFFSVLSHGQITKGNWLVGGTGSVLRQQESLLSSDVNITRVQISPDIGYFLIDKFSAGLKPSLDYIRTNTDGRTGETTLFSLGPFVRYYFLPADNMVNVFAETSYQYSSSSNGSRSNIYHISAGPVLYFNTSVGLEFTINYDIGHFNGSVTSSKTFSLGVGFQIHLEKEKND